MMGLAITRYPLSIQVRSENDKVHKVEKVTIINARPYQTHMHIFRLWGKHVQSFKKNGIKLYELCSRGTHCLYIEGEK